MIKTKFGMFDGNSWEAICQQCFKQIYADEGYQEMNASPGDFGIEGYTLHTGKVFQCYCPNTEYTKTELREKIRDKITKDIEKLKIYQVELKKRLGKTKIKRWYFVTPSVESNKLLEHATSKSDEVRCWGLDFIDDEFAIEIRDIDFYSNEFSKIITVKGEKLLLGDYAAIVNIDWTSIGDKYIDNVNRKNSKRIGENNINTYAVSKLNDITFKRLTDGDSLIKEIAKDHPDLYILINRVINQYEDEVEESSLTWAGEPNDLIVAVKDELESRLLCEVDFLSTPDIKAIVNHVIARWLALCPLDIT